MSHKIIQLDSALPDETVDAWAGQFMDESHYDFVTSEDVEIRKPDGSVLLRYCPDRLPIDVCAAAFSILKEAAGKTENRGHAGGRLDQVAKVHWPTNAKVTGDGRYRKIKKDGTISNTARANSVKSGIVGYFDRYPRIPYCRLTAFNLEHPERFQTSIPFIRAVDGVFKEESPERHEKQMGMIRKTSPDFYIHGTAFTTITVNSNFRTALHKDAGDYVDGFGVMACLRAGEYEGGYLVFPKYRVAVDMRTCGVCLADVHEWHGNTRMNGVPGQFERLSCVFYYREHMADCGSAAEELQRAKALRDHH